MKDNKDIVAAAKFALGPEGVGTIDEALVEKRAIELARIEGRDDYNAKDLAEARAQLSAAHDAPIAPEVISPEVENVVAWDEPASVDGERRVTRELDDENTIGELLVQEGVEEADHDRRVSASDVLDKEG